MASLLIAYSESRTIEPPPHDFRPPDSQFASLINIEPITADNLETILRMLLKQLADVGI